MSSFLNKNTCEVERHSFQFDTSKWPGPHQVGWSLQFGKLEISVNALIRQSLFNQ